MTQKMVVGLLILTVIGAVAIGLYDASQSDDPVGTELLALETGETLPAENMLSVTPTQAAADPAVSEPAVAADPAASTDPAQPVQQQQAINQVGDPWQDSGLITAFDTNGMFFTGTLSGDIYVELGPNNFWQQQPVPLAVSDIVRVEGFFNGEQYHAATVIKADGTQLALRTAEGLPLWSGGSNGNSNGEQNQQGQDAQVQVEPVDWITLEGAVTAFSGNMLTMQTLDAQIFDLQLGQASFMAEQGITFAVGDEITVLGYWQGTLFKAGEITKTATGERLMLLDPNGRPLWGGPGRSGEQGQGGQGQSNGGSSQDSGGNSGSGNSGNSSNGGGGNGNGYRGGRNS
ncbi:MAG: hypothetical protein JXQ72_07930 [Anaerolineae bacterium]|nr:hypothetical protein [Anaerolineae bacterium]